MKILRLRGRSKVQSFQHEIITSGKWQLSNSKKFLLSEFVVLYLQTCALKVYDGRTTVIVLKQNSFK